MERNYDDIERLEDMILDTRPSVIKVDVCGEEYTMRELSKESGIPVRTLYNRYYAGDRGLELVRPLVKTLTYDGRTQTINAWAKELGVAPIVLYKRVERGWTDEECIRLTRFERRGKKE